MSEARKSPYTYKNILGDAKETIDAIQRYIEGNARVKIEPVKDEEEMTSINRVLNSVACKETNEEINKIIKNL